MAKRIAKVRGHLALMALAILALLVCFVGAAFAQTTTGTITGTITDPKGAAMAGVTVTVHNADTGIDTSVRTNDSGIYTATLLQPGNYEVTAAQTGFSSVQNKGVRVQVGETVRIDIEMPVASQQSLVTVTTEAPLIETEKTEASQTVSETLVSDLPVSSRRWEQFVMLTPGVAPDGPSGGMTWHGVNSMYNGNSVDGANNMNMSNGAARGAPANDGYVYSGDSIREFQVASSNYNAELGNAGGAVNAVTKSGTSQIHGDAFYNMRNPIFNALDPVVKTAAAVAHTTPTQSVHQQNQFGGSVGGPILKDKLFYFVTYDGYRKVTPIAFTSSTNIAALGCPTNTADVSAVQCAAAKSYILNDNLGIFPRELVQDVALGKIDYQANASNHFNAVFNWRDWFEPLSTAPATVANSGLTTSANPWLQDRFVIGTWNKVIGNDKVNQLFYQYGSDNSYSQLRGGPGPSSLTAGLQANQVPPNVTLSNIFTYGSNSADPGISFEDRHQIDDSFSFESGRHSFKVGVDLNFLHDRIRAGMTFGGFYQYTNGVLLDPFTPGGGPAPAAQVGCPASSGSGLIFCDWLVDLYGAPTFAIDPKLGVLTSTVNTGQHFSTYAQIRDTRYPGDQDGAPLPNGQIVINDDFTSQMYGSYFQDTWKVKSNLTLNLGIRYDVQMLPQPTAPNTATPLLALYTTKININYDHIGPRVGFAWNVAKETVIRGGFGVFYGTVPLSSIYIDRISSGVDWQQFNCSPGATTSPCGGTGYASGLTFPNVLYAQQAASPGPAAPFVIPGVAAGQQPLTPVVENPPGSNCPTAPGQNFPGCGTRAIDPNFDGPMALEGEAGIERQLPGHLALTATYVFTRGTHLPAYWDSNLAPATVSKTYDIVNAAGVTQSTATLPLYTTRLNTNTGPILTEHSVVNSMYNGLIVTLRKQASHGFEFLANYTYSHSTDDGQAAFATGAGLTGEVYFTGPPILDPYNVKGEQAISALNVPNRFAGSVVWAPDFAKKLGNKFEKGALDGWSLSSTITAANGSPISGIVQSSAPVCSLGSNASGAGCTNPATGPAGVLGLDGGMTGAALTTIGQSTGGRIGWQPRDSFTLPNYSDVDVRLARQFTLKERYNFEFRAEAFNLFNSTIVQAVNTNAYNYVGAGTGICASHTNTCMSPVSAFLSPTTTSNVLLGARQMQFGFRFEF
jgi:hypothetical protein